MSKHLPFSQLRWYSANKHTYSPSSRAAQGSQCISESGNTSQNSENAAIKFATRALVLVLLFTAGLFTDAAASHFRFGNLSWSRTAGSNTVKYDFTHGWAYGAGTSYAYLNSNYGSITVPSSLVARPTDGSGLTYDMYQGQGSITYPSTGIYTASYASCCRIYGLMNGSSGSWAIESTINMAYPNNTGSPVSTVPAIVTMQQNQFQGSYRIPAFDPDGDPIRFRTVQATGMTSNPFTIDPNTGVLHFNTIGRNVNEKWVCAVVMEDLSPSGQVMSSTMIDFIVEIVTSNSVPPVFNYATTPANNQLYQISPGTAVNFNVSANDNDLGSTVSLVGIGLPTGSSFNVINGNPANGSFSWTPNANQLGAYVVNFTAQDNVGLQTQSSVTIVVSLKPRFDVPPTPMANHHMVYEPGTAINYTIQASDPDPTDVVRIISAEAKDVNGNWGPLHSGMITSALPSAAANPTTASFSWTPSAANWGHNHIRFVAEDSYGDRSTHEISQLINTNPVFTSTPTTTATVGTMYSYTITGNDADISQGDQLSFSGITIPSWLTLTDNGNGTATLSGTPTTADAGTNAVSVQLEDINHHANMGGIPTQNFDIEVSACQLSASCSGDINAFTSTSTILPAGSVNVNINGNNSTIYGSGNTYNFQDPVPAGKEIISVDIAYTIYYPYNCCAASNEAYIGNTHVGTKHSSSPAGNKNETYTFTGSLPDYNYGGTNSFRLTSWWNSVRIQNVTLTFNYGTKGGLCGSNVIVAAPSVNSSCGIASITNDFNNSADASDFYPIGTTQVNWTIVDNNGLTTTCQQNVNVTDDELPTVLTQDITVQLDASGNASLTASDIDNGTSDNCGIASLSVNQSTFSCVNTGTNIVTLTATDNNGNVSTANATVTVEDNSAPVVLTKNITVQLDANGNASITAADVNNGTSDVCGIASLVVSKTSFDCSNVGNNTVTLTATDVNGNTATANAVVTVEDNVAPVAMAKDITVQLDANGNATVTPAMIENGSSDACGIANISLQTSVTGTIQATANEGYNLTLTAPAGAVITAINFASYGTPNVSNGQFTQGWCHAATSQAVVETYALGNNSVIIPATNTVFGDPCGGTYKRLFITATYSAAGGTSQALSYDCSNIGSNSVILAVTDNNGNVSTANATVTVEDNVAPVVVTNDITVQLNANGNASITAADVNNGTSDACGIASLVVSKTSFDCSNVGNNTVTLTATDVNGNIATATAIVTVEDNVAPVALAKDITVQLDANGNASATAAAVNNGSYDACGIASISLSKTTFDCTNVGSNPVVLTVTDNNGNVSMANATVSVEDNINPTVITQNIIIQLDANGNASITTADIDNGSSDNCGIASLELDQTAFDCSHVGLNTVTLTATDVNGNSASLTAHVTVEDNVAPAAIAQDVTVTLSGGAASITAADINNGSNDACGIASIVVNQTSFDCSMLGDNAVILTITDNNGNVSTANATVHVVGAIPTPSIAAIPMSNVFTGGNPNMIYLGYGSQSVMLQATGGVSYAWANASNMSSLNIDNPVFTPTTAGTYNFVVTATNEYGCSATAEITIEVVDARCGNAKNPKVIVCHKGREICVDENAVPAHLAHGCSVGSCTNTRTSSSAIATTEATIYPNPFSNKALLDFDVIKGGSYTVELIDSKGAVVGTLASGEAAEDSKQSVLLDGSVYPNGVYIVRLITPDAISHSRIVIQH